MKSVYVFLLVMGLLLLGASLIPPRPMGPHPDTSKKVSNSYLRTLGAAVEAYQIEYSKYPSNLAELVKPGKSGTAFLDAPELPLSAWGEDYVYINLEDKDTIHPYELFYYEYDGGGDSKLISVWDLRDKKIILLPDNIVAL